MLGVQSYWSDEALSDFAALFDDQTDGEALRNSVAVALTKGWSGNRDKPLWALGLLIHALARSPLGSPAGSAHPGFDILSHTPNAIFEALRSSTCVDPQATTSAKGRLTVRIPGLDQQSYGHNNVATLQRTANFLLMCDNAVYAPEIIKTFDRLAHPEGDERAVAQSIRNDIKALARILYDYRKKHILDGHGASAFSVIKKYLHTQGGGRIDDETPFGFWTWEDNDKYKSYGESYVAIADFAEKVSLALQRRAIASAADIDDAVVRAARDADASSVVAGNDNEHPHGDGEEPDADPGAVPDAVDEDEGALTFAEAPILLFSINELKLIGWICEHVAFGARNPRAFARHLGFRDVQNNISNGLKFKTWKIPLEERVTCVEAIPYADLQRDLDALEAQILSRVEDALALRRNGEDAVGDSVRFRFRKGQSRDSVDVVATFAQLEPALLRALEDTRTLSGALKRRFARPTDTYTTAFEADQQLFTAEYRRRYLPVSAAS